MNKIIPSINTEELQIAANKYAQEGAVKTIKDFYTGYNSPYIKALEENLLNRGFDHAFTLPDVVANINEALSAEIDKIANTAVAKTFIPLVTKILTRADAEIKFSKILEEFIRCVRFEHDTDQDSDDFNVEAEKGDDSFLTLIISNIDKSYEIGLYHEGRHNKELEDVYTIFSLPRNHGKSNQTMKIALENATLELPFTPSILHDDFIAFIAGLVMANTKITFDVMEFNDEMFPSRGYCHC
ncbi:hypothetical protein DNC80_14280 [Flavobacterium sp. SOK18b]|uniref:hypothetical protein n=1 Tax=Flavobacterium sp. SOK18b TaxID=797900 RepID=UPI0015FA200E|nr:hypothetical protein [Flavobacterium sp. SOK18b]MBB1194834.1 hypothetical protein [Flavobacterium sp. SOK18b]